MPNYQYRCPVCTLEVELYQTFDDSDYGHKCPKCDFWMRKVLGAYYKRSMTAGYSPSTGSYVSSERDLADQLHRAAEAATARTGLPHSYVPIDMRDRAQTGQTDEGLDATIRQQVAEGKREVKQWL